MAKPTSKKNVSEKTLKKGRKKNQNIIVVKKSVTLLELIYSKSGTNSTGAAATVRVEK